MECASLRLRLVSRQFAAAPREMYKLEPFRATDLTLTAEGRSKLRPTKAVASYRTPRAILCTLTHRRDAKIQGIVGGGMKRQIAAALLLLACTLSIHAQTGADSWIAVSGHVMTRWADKVSPDNAWREYPRPQMRRGENSWVNLNGLWDFARTKSAELPDPGVYRRKILVPFPVESALSGIKEAVDGTDFLFYRRRFVRPDDLARRRVLLHFGAVDWHSAVWINGKKIGEHKGGYDPF